MGFEVKGKIALVTGANRGIGRVILEKLVSEGASKVYAAVRNPGLVADLIADSAGRVESIQLDLGDPDSIIAAAAQADDVQLLINNAGVLKMANPLEPGAVAALQHEMEINVYGLMRIAQAFAPVLAKNGGGALVQLNSVASLKCFADFATYSASKAAAYSITQGLKDYLNKQGTAVVSVHPGPIATEMADSAGLADIAEPASLVADAIIHGLADGQFHVFPDSMARNFWQGYEEFARALIEPVMAGEDAEVG